MSMPPYDNTQGNEVVVYLIATNRESGVRSLMRWKQQTRQNVLATYKNFLERLEQDPNWSNYTFMAYDPRLRKRILAVSQEHQEHQEHQEQETQETHVPVPEPYYVRDNYKGGTYEVSLKGTDPQGNPHLIKFHDREASSLVGAYRMILDSLREDAEWNTWSFQPVPRKIQKILAEHGPTRNPKIIPNLRPDDIAPWEPWERAPEPESPLEPELPPDPDPQKPQEPQNQGLLRVLGAEPTQE